MKKKATKKSKPKNCGQTYNNWLNTAGQYIINGIIKEGFSSVGYNLHLMTIAYEDNRKAGWKKSEDD